MRRPSHPLFVLFTLASASFLLGCPGEEKDPDPDQQTGIASVTVTSPSASLPAGQTVQLAAVARDEAGAVRAGTVFAWTSSDSSKVSVNSTGLATAISGGSATITASAGGRSGSVALSVPTAGSVHSSRIEADEVWRAADGPHVVESIIYIGGPSAPMLRIEAGTEVRFAAGAGLFVGIGEAGALRIEGTAEKPVKLTAHALTPSKGHWKGLKFGWEANDNSALQHVLLEYCGGRASDEEACVTFESQKIEVQVVSVTVSKSSTRGFDFGDTIIADGSSRLSVVDSAGPAISISPEQAGRLPTGGTFTGNVNNTVVIDAPHLEKSVTWPNLGIPYVLPDNLYVAGDTSPTLTLQPGTELRFGAGVTLDVGVGGAGNIKAIGTATAPILFTSSAATPAPGSWKGLQLGTLTNAALTKLDHVIVRFGGGGYGDDDANIQVLAERGPVVTNSVIEHSEECGITRHVHGAPVTTDFTAPALGNSFANNAGGAQCGP